MSKWTYVNGVITLDTFARSDAEAMYMAQTVVTHLPRITGSEGDVRYYLQRPHGHNMSSNRDEFEVPSNLGSGYYGTFETQSRILLTLDGSLRDRDLEQTLIETTRALARLASRLSIGSCLVSVSAWDKHYVFDNPNWLLSMPQNNWARNLLWRFSWEEE